MKGFREKVLSFIRMERVVQIWIGITVRESFEKITYEVIMKQS